ncbi:Uncharacterised protein (plasmid) [Legionella adelaidensis]|uniref:Transmembrane protein n=1 Tax=Legionella adelaidensis TaxID=45056 RepID=A0A0W0R143_9GAMM|nr:hypothetical protein [Legionella adelaidensis]KTC64786.1 hypothetical protein Lade_2080 [Legionella adelaidensis]VEH82698.1 Uncharacterised protein [Legionella adelaidensis]
MNIKEALVNLIQNPSAYIAAVIGTPVGGASGALIGAAACSFILSSYGICPECKDPYFHLDIGISMGVLIGLIIGSIIGGGTSLFYTVYKIHQKTFRTKEIAQNNIADIVLYSLGYSAELAVSMILGAIIGSLKSLGYGTAIGGVIGIVLLLIIKQFEKR